MELCRICRYAMCAWLMCEGRMNIARLLSCFTTSFCLFLILSCGGFLPGVAASNLRHHVSLGAFVSEFPPTILPSDVMSRRKSCRASYSPPRICDLKLDPTYYRFCLLLGKVNNGQASLGMASEQDQTIATRRGGHIALEQKREMEKNQNEPHARISSVTHCDIVHQWPHSSDHVKKYIHHFPPRKPPPPRATQPSHVTENYEFLSSLFVNATAMRRYYAEMSHAVQCGAVQQRTTIPASLSTSRDATKHICCQANQARGYHTYHAMLSPTSHLHFLFG